MVCIFLFVLNNILLTSFHFGIPYGKPNVIFLIGGICKYIYAYYIYKKWTGSWKADWGMLLFCFWYIFLKSIIYIQKSERFLSV